MTALTPLGHRPASGVRGPRPDSSATQLITASVGLLGFGASCLCIAYAISLNEAFLWTSFAAALTASPLLVVLLTGPQRLFHPLTLVALTLGLGCLGQVVYLEWFDDSNGADLLSGLDEGIIGKGLLVTGAGVTAMLLGFLAVGSRTGRGAAQPREEVRPTLSLDYERLTLFVVAFALIGALATAALAVLVGATSPASILSSEKRLVEVGGALQAYGYLRSGIALSGVAFLLSILAACRSSGAIRTRFKRLGVASFLIAILAAVFTSSRTDVFAVALVGLVLLATVLGREPSVRTALAAFAVTLVGLSALLTLRLVGQDQAASFEESFSDESVLASALGSRDFMAIGPASVVVEEVPDSVDFQYGRSLVSILWTPVPRSVWPDKPPVRIGPEIGPTIFGFPYARRSGDPPGMIGELWLNGGWLAVLLGGFAWGCALGRLQTLYARVRSNPTVLAPVYAVLSVALGFILANNDVTGTLIFALTLLTPMLVALRLSRDEPLGDTTRAVRSPDQARA